MSVVDEVLKQQTYGDWHVLEFVEYRKRTLYFSCQCKCGIVSRVSGSNLRSGHSLRCSTCAATMRRTFNENEKLCGRCKEWLSLDEFLYDPRRPSKRCAYCRTCDTIRRHHITKDEYLQMLRRQNQQCAISGCKNFPSHVDHDHSCCSGKRSCGKCVRGVLCARHNTAMGGFSDDPVELRNAAWYIEEYRNHHGKEGSV